MNRKTARREPIQMTRPHKGAEVQTDEKNPMEAVEALLEEEIQMVTTSSSQELAAHSTNRRRRD